MNNLKALEMLNNGRIEDLKKELQDEIYAESLKKKPGAKQRYAAMKRYFKYSPTTREVLTRPCAIEFEGERLISFCNSYSLALTRESTGEIVLFDESMGGTYPDVTKLINYDGNIGGIDFAKVFAEAKSKGYKLKQNEVIGDARFYMYYEGAYYRLGLIDITFSVVNDGEEAVVYKKDGPHQKLTIATDVGIAVVMPMRLETDPDELGVTVIFA